MVNTLRMRTTISPRQLAAMDSCFGLAGLHQHIRGCFRHPFNWQLHTTNVRMRYVLAMPGCKAGLALACVTLLHMFF